jgi:N-acetylneuraminic acid mutarotase
MSNWLEILENPWSKRRKHQAVELNDKLLILGGFDGENAFDLNDVWSWDGYSWTLLTEHARWSGRDGHCAVVHDGVIFILGGTDDPYFCKKDVWKSTDGK